MSVPIGKLSLGLFLCLAARAEAQDFKQIDVFDDQASMSAAPIRVDAVTGSEEGGDSFDGDGGETSSFDGGFTLRFERTGTTILVPATVQGRAVYFVFDTGASYTTLSGAFAKSAGIFPGPKAPIVQFQTANGTSEAPLGVIDSLSFGGRSHSGVTYSVCDSCPAGVHKGKPVVGLLGMNLLGRYRTSFDHGAGVIEMSPSESYSDQWRDIQPFLDVKFGHTSIARNGRGWVLHGTVENRSPRKIQQMTLRHWCTGGTPSESSRSVGAGKKAKFEVLIKDGDCKAGFDGEVVNARW